MFGRTCVGVTNAIALVRHDSQHVSRNLLFLGLRLQRSVIPVAAARSTRDGTCFRRSFAAARWAALQYPLCRATDSGQALSCFISVESQRDVGRRNHPKSGL